MPTITDRRKAVQRKALAKQRNRMREFAHKRKALARLRAQIRKARFNIGRRKRLIQAAEGVTITGNEARGGTAQQRLRAVAIAAANAHASGRRRSFYSQSGRWSVRYAITGEPRGYRSDCSQWVTAVYWSAELGDPNHMNYGGGYTGTLASHGRQVSSNDLEAGDLGFYGSYPYHHVEMYVGNGRWVGHGTPAVDSVTPGFPNHFRRYV